MIELIKRTQYQKMPWKNGQGETEQIAIHPAKANLENFSWRLSLAPIMQNGPFSLFPEKVRFLVLWKGNGIKLNQRTISNFQIVEFSGDEKMQAELIDQKVEDLGLIFDEEKVSAMMDILNTSQELELEADTYFLFCAEGSAQVNEFQLSPGDCLRLTNESDMSLKVAPQSKLIWISLQDE